MSTPFRIAAVAAILTAALALKMISFSTGTAAVAVQPRGLDVMTIMIETRHDLPAAQADLS